MATSGTTVKFAPVNGNDTMMKNNTSVNINTKHQCITVMKEYESKSLEELILEDYAENRSVTDSRYLMFVWNFELVSRPIADESCV